MSKKKINLKITQNSNILNENIIGIMEENSLKFFLEQKKVTLLINKDNIIMDRKIDNDMYIKMIFDKNNPKAMCIMNDKVFDMKIEVNELIIKENEIKIQYKLEENDFGLELKVGEIWLLKY